MAEIDAEVLITATKGGKRVTETFRKFELITTHTARRSFATNAYLNTVPTISIMKITGTAQNAALFGKDLSQRHRVQRQ
ncbi:MAG: integrase [Flavisolibacter sp.]|nr:integrase [Flavisolibacter sp.]